MYTGPCSKGGGSDEEPDVKSASFMNVMPCKAYMCAEVETQSDNDLDLEDDKNSEEGEVKEVCDIGCFGWQIGVATQKRENTTERGQDPRACLDQDKCMQLKSKLFLLMQHIYSQDYFLVLEVQSRLSHSNHFS